MSIRKEKINITDQLGFIHYVELIYYPHFGFTNAVYNGEIIAQRSYGRITEPFGDDDAEWERYEELFGEWSDAAKSDLNIACKEHFNNKLKRNQ